MVSGRLGPIFVKTMLKALAMILRFVKSLPFAVVILDCLLFLFFNVILCRIPFQRKGVSFLFLPKQGLK